MDRVFGSLFSAEQPASWQTVLLCMLLSFALCKLIAASYVWSYRGLSYSRGFVQSLVMGGVVSTLLLLAIGDSVARGLGLLGTLALIRFRATLKDSRDMVFIFASLAVGVAAGVQAYFVAMVGTASFCLFSLYLSNSSFGSRRQFDGLLRFQAPATDREDESWMSILKQYCSSLALVNLREVAQGRLVERAYQVKLIDPSYSDPLVTALRTVPDLGGVSILMQDQGAEL
jgi:hypothetical protein